MVAPSYQGKPHPIGYVEEQLSFDKTNPELFNSGVTERIAKVLREQPHLEHISTRWTASPGHPMVVAYIGFAPKHESSEPLDPRNLNDAPLPQAGMPEPEDGILPLGHKESGFGRGT